MRNSFKILSIEFDVITIKFIIVGIANTLFGTTIMFVCYNVFHINYWWSSAANYFFGSILSYFLNKYFTFRSSHKTGRELLKFTINICLCYFVAYGVAKPLARMVLTNAGTTLQENVAMVFGMGIFVGLNYIGQRYFVFTHAVVPEDNQ